MPMIEQPDHAHNWKEMGDDRFRCIVCYEWKREMVQRFLFCTGCGAPKEFELGKHDNPCYTCGGCLNEALRPIITAEIDREILEDLR
jgi:hypothetical protein